MKSKTALEAQIIEKNHTGSKHEEALRVCEEDMKLKNEEIKIQDKYSKNQVDTLKGENLNLNSLLESREAELQRERR